MSSKAKKAKSSVAPSKSKGGRPTDYRPEYCEQIVEFCKRGNFIVAFAVEIGVHTDTFQEWRKKHPEFSVAYKKAKEANKAFLLKTALSGGIGRVPNYQGSSLIFLLKAVHGLNEFGPQEQEDTELEFTE